MERFLRRCGTGPSQLRAKNWSQRTLLEESTGRCRLRPRAATSWSIWHVLEQDRRWLELAALPPGHQADREAVGEPWVISRFEWDED